MDIWTFLTIVILAFSLLMLVLGIFSAYFGAGKNKAYGAIMALIGLIVGIFWAYIAGNSDIEPFCNVYVWDAIYNAVINLLGVLIGALVAVGIFLVLVLKS